MEKPKISEKDLVHSGTGDEYGVEKIADAPSVQVKISKDEMSATLTLFPPPEKDKNFSLEDIIIELNNAGVVYGIDTNKIKEMLEKGIFNTPIEIAKGLEPKAGEDGKIIYHIEIHKELKPKIDKDGRVDFHDLGFITNVTKGQLLAEIVPPEKGSPGKTVTGKTIPAKDGKQVKLRQGKNVVFSEDGKKIFSAIDGHPVIDGDKVSVLPVMEIRGDVGPSTGNIDFVGSVKIYGNVKSGYKVKAEGDIEVEGYVEAAEIISGGKVVLKRGIRGMGKGVVKAAQDIVAKFVENSTLIAGRNIIAHEAIMHSLVSAGSRIEVRGKKGLLVGGTVRAGEEIKAKVIGSPMATFTEVEVGVTLEQKRKLLEISEELENVESALSKARKAIEILEKQKNKEDLSKDKLDMLRRLKESEMILDEKRKVLQEEKEKLALIMQNSTTAKISVYDAVFPGVTIIIANASMKLKDKIEHATFYNYEGQIKFRPYESESR
ncbi:MAG: FapA family protein [Thermosediminibacteraceae bacterium]|nr:FapA family protein [Thermosediminibacteraceae bacterium]